MLGTDKNNRVNTQFVNILNDSKYEILFVYF